MKINHPESINVSVASAIHKQKSQNNLNETSNGDKQKVQSQNVNDPNGNVIKSEVIEKKNSKGNHLNQSTESVDSFALKLQKMTKIQRQAHFFFVRPSSRMVCQISIFYIVFETKKESILFIYNC